MNFRPRYLIGFLLIIGGLIYLGSTVFQSSLQYYVTVDEFFATPDTYQNKTLKVAGKVKDGSIHKADGSSSVYNFVIIGASHEMPVHYKGLVPDTFKAGGDVVATGKMAPDGTFQANHILAKCASKYEAKMGPQ
jgi:cytochrome c-type biogenesis protein CcmE